MLYPSFSFNFLKSAQAMLRVLFHSHFFMPARLHARRTVESTIPRGIFCPSIMQGKRRSTVAFFSLSSTLLPYAASAMSFGAGAPTNRKYVLFFFLLTLLSINR